MATIITQVATSPPIFTPRYLNLDFIFYKFYELVMFFWGIISGANPLLFLKVLLAILIIVLTVIAAYSFIRLKEIREREMEKLKTVKIVEPVHTASSRLVAIEEHAYSNNPNDWKQAIIDADTMLDELVGRMGYQGENLGERLKAIDKKDFKLLDEAWEAHRIRNRIAHDGSVFELSQHEARRVIGIYRDIFSQFNFA